MNVTAGVLLLNLVLGVAYCGYGVMTILEMRRDRDTFGFSHFGLAWIFMAFTCGPHHLAHAVHLAVEGRVGGPLDVFAVLVGLPVGVIWLGLRVEAFAGGRGDRFIAGTPRWVAAAPAAAVIYVATLTLASVITLSHSHRALATSGQGLVANGALVVIYMAIGWFVLRTQLTNRPSLGGWSLSGLCLAAIFPTCALMHAIFGVYSVEGLYHYDIHGAVIDWLSIPAGLYFLWVVHRLYMDALSDWNGGPSEVVSVSADRELAGAQRH